MRNAETVLGIIQDRGKRGLTLEDAYRQLFNPNHYLRAYGRIYHNDGALTRGATAETVDGMSQEKIAAIIEQMRHERHRWTQVRRVYIPKANGKMRPLGVPAWTDELLQEVIRSILEAYYEPQFSSFSNGFRPERGCHTALIQIQQTWIGTKWFIEGDIKGFFDNTDHENISLGKAGASRWRGIRPANRGVSMNPVDHPHGGGEGKTSGGRHPVTPWGQPTRGYKTRNNKRTDVFILNRRSK